MYVFNRFKPSDYVDENDPGSHWFGVKVPESCCERAPDKVGEFVSTGKVSILYINP